MPSNKFKSKLLIVISVLLTISFLIYLIFRNSCPVVGDLAPEFIGILIFAFIITYGFAKRSNLKTFLSVMLFILITAIGLYIYGKTKDVAILTDIMPELIGGTAIGLIMSIIFNRKYIL